MKGSNYTMWEHCLHLRSIVCSTRRIARSGPSGLTVFAVDFRSEIPWILQFLDLTNSGLVGRKTSGKGSRGEKMAIRGIDPESYITEYT